MSVFHNFFTKIILFLMFNVKDSAFKVDSQTFDLLYAFLISYDFLSYKPVTLTFVPINNAIWVSYDETFFIVFSHSILKSLLAFTCIYHQSSMDLYLNYSKCLGLIRPCDSAC
jgi:hypothetical protein